MARDREQKNAYMEEYQRRPEVKARRSAYRKKWRQRPEQKEQRAAYQRTPEVKARQSAYQRTPEARAKVAAYRKEKYYNDPEYKEQRAAAHARWIERNREKARAWNRLRYRERDRWYYELKAGLSCAICGEDRPPCLDFHHRDPSQKEFSVSVGVNKGYAKERILAEIEKCDVICRNCHAVLHSELE